MIVTPNKKMGLGWLPQLTDPRDLLYAAPRLSTYPASVDKSKLVHSILSQGQVGCCTGAGTSNMAMGKYIQSGFHNPFEPSMLEVYRRTRELEGTQDYDSGASVRDALKAVHLYGICNEKYMSMGQYSVSDAVPELAANNALKHVALQYQAVASSVTARMACLADPRTPGFVFGFTCYSGLESEQAAETGLIPTPLPNDRPIGGHCMWCTGYLYLNNQLYFTGPQSWGQGWGKSGFWIMSSSYPVSDCWTILQVGAAPAS